MKEYIYQFYNEGFATTFCVRPINFLNKHLKNKKIMKILSVLIKIIYTIFVLILAWMAFWDKYPL